ncbi:TIGR03619 family F420-dependent LLM class oxidoreductase [Streptomyces sp. NPDC057963]|uniref:TIGR03619 family F420-dependent LLM class oxidoreductase n=1 Tax=Streptomyces sp. NPDC057963 TaxID=3346290 RepID=UPI0036E238C8
MSRPDAGGQLELGVALPTNRKRLTGRELRDIVGKLEDAGCTALWVNDHLAAFPVGAETYPYSPTGEITWDPKLPQYEALTTCGYLACVNDRMKIGTSVLVLPQRHPVEVSKAAASLADLSEGRFRLGVGAGWSRKEMALLGWDPATRGRRMDEELDIIRASWGQGRRAARWEHYDIPDDVIHEPQPLPGTAPPILVGGMSEAATRRVLNHGDGWLAVAPGNDPTAVARAGAKLARLRSSCPRPLRGVLKIALSRPGGQNVAHIVEQAADDGWDEISFEFDEWELDETCSLLSTCRSRGRTAP